MKREILFRAKRIDNNEWIEGYLFEDISPTRHISYIIQAGFVPALSMPSSNFREVDNNTIGQFTGLIDKNGNKVFEGDFDADGNVVVWCENCNGWEFGALDIPTNEICISCHRCDGNFFFEDHITDFEAIDNICQNDPANTCDFCGQPAMTGERYDLKVGYKNENGNMKEVIINAENCDEAYNLFKKQFGDIKVEYID